MDMSKSSDADSCRHVLEEGVTRGDCHKCSEKAGGKAQKDTGQDTGSSHDPWSDKVTRVKQEMEEENGLYACVRSCVVFRVCPRI